MNGALLGMLGYVLVQFAIGAWVSRRMASETDYILAGRSLGAGLVAFSVFATWFGAEAITVSAGEVYDKGLSGATVDPFGYAAAVLVVGVLLAGRLWRGGYVTYADMFRERFSPGVEQLFVIMLLPGSILWAAAQIRAFGQVISSSSGMSVTTAITLAAVLVAGYSVVGGLLADAITDVVQGLAVIIGLIVLAVTIVLAAGGLGASLQHVTPERLDMLRGAESPLLRLEQLAITICGSIVAVELVSRFLGARSAQAARNGTVIGGLLYLAVGCIPIFLGLVGSRFVPGLSEPEQIVPKLAEQFMPVFGYTMFAGALISAILSTVHSALHAPAAQVSHNIVLRLLPGLGPRERLLSVRLTVLGLSLVAFILALSVTRIRDLVELASAFGTAGAFVTALFAVFTRIGGASSAYAAMLGGMATWSIGKFGFGISAPYLKAIGVSAFVYVLVAFVEKQKQDAIVKQPS